MSLFVRKSEEVASSINGECPNGDQMLLGDDVLIYFKLCGFEQPVLDRLRSTKTGTLATEITNKQGFIYLGELETVRRQLHSQVDKLFAAITEFRNSKRQELAK